MVGHAPLSIGVCKVTRIPLRIGKSGVKGSLSPSSPFSWEICAFSSYFPRGGGTQSPWLSLLGHLKPGILMHGESDQEVTIQREGDSDNHRGEFPGGARGTIHHHGKPRESEVGGPPPCLQGVSGLGICGATVEEAGGWLP